MLLEKGYHCCVPRSIRASVVLLTLLSATALVAQVNGLPPSVTSLGFGGHTAFNPPGVPASVTSLGPAGVVNNPILNPFPVCCLRPLATFSSNPPLFHHRRHQFPLFPVAVPVYTVPYTPVVIVQPTDETMEEEDDSGGPTIFDRRGPGPRRTAYSDRYVERAPRDDRDRESPAPKAYPEAVAAPETPVVDQPATVLVYKDGHQVEVQNYAIVADLLYDLTPGHRRRIALAELDLAETAKQNDDRGIDFRLPAGSNAN